MFHISPKSSTSAEISKKDVERQFADSGYSDRQGSKKQLMTVELQSLAKSPAVSTARTSLDQALQEYRSATTQSAFQKLLNLQQAADILKLTLITQEDSLLGKTGVTIALCKAAMADAPKLSAGNPNALPELLKHLDKAVNQYADHNESNALAGFPALHTALNAYMSTLHAHPLQKNHSVRTHADIHEQVKRQAAAAPTPPRRPPQFAFTNENAPTSSRRVMKSDIPATEPAPATGKGKRKEHKVTATPLPATEPAPAVTEAVLEIPALAIDAQAPATDKGKQAEHKIENIVVTPPQPKQAAPATPSGPLPRTDGIYGLLQKKDKNYRSTEKDGEELMQLAFSGKIFPDVTPKESRELYYFHKNKLQRLQQEKPWLKKIPIRDLLAIRFYSIYADHLNDALKEWDEKKIEEFSPFIKTIISGLNQLAPHSASRYRFSPAWVIRGKKLTASEIASKYIEGKAFTETGFTSTSANSTGYSEMTEKYNVQMRILSKQGKKISEISLYEDDESEVLFPPGTRFKVTKVEYLNSKRDPEFPRVNIVMEEIEEEQEEQAENRQPQT